MDYVAFYTSKVGPSHGSATTKTTLQSFFSTVALWHGWQMTASTVIRVSTWVGSKMAGYAIEMAMRFSTRKELLAALQNRPDRLAQPVERGAPDQHVVRAKLVQLGLLGQRPGRLSVMSRSLSSKGTTP